MALVRRRRGAHLPRSAQQVRKQIPHTKSCVRRRDSLHRTRALLNKRGRIPSRRNRKEASQRHTNRADHPLRSRPRHRSPPERIDSATKRGETKIHDLTVRQHFVPEEWLEIGRTTISMGGIDFPAYDLERMLLELMRSRNKLPHDLYKEAVLSFRNRSDKMDIYKLQDYAEAIPHGEAHLERAFFGGGRCSNET